MPKGATTSGGEGPLGYPCHFFLILGDTVVTDSKQDKEPSLTGQYQGHLQHKCHEASFTPPCTNTSLGQDTSRAAAVPEQHLLISSIRTASIMHWEIRSGIRSGLLTRKMLQ